MAKANCNIIALTTPYQMIISYCLGKGVAGADKGTWNIEFNGGRSKDRGRYIVIWHIILYIAPNALLMGVGCGNDGYWRVYIPIHLFNMM